MSLTVSTTEYRKIPTDNLKVHVTCSHDGQTGIIKANFEDIPTVDEQKKEINAMNERIKKIERQRSLELVACGFILGAVCCLVLYVLTGGYL